MPAERVHVYELTEPLSRGGPGTSHRARVAESGGPLDAGRDVQFRTVTAHEAGGELGIDRLLKSHAAARRIASPSVLSPVDHGILHRPDGRRFWSVCPWVEARTLSSLLATIEIVPDPLTESIAAGIVSALVDTHAAGVFGIGLGPDSVLLRDDTSVVLADPAFGPAVDPLWPREGVAPAAMMCAAPEILTRVGTPCERSDLYAVGAILYRCMVGRWHRPDDARALRASAAEMPALRPNDERPRASLFLSEVVHALLAPDREDRIESAAALAQILAERRKSAWWQGRHIDQDTDGEAARAPLPAPPAPTAIPEPVAPPDAAWFSERRLRSAGIGEAGIPCLGRDDEIAHVLACASELSREMGGVVFLSGPAASGKTRLLDAVIERFAALPDAEAPLVLHGTHRRVGVGRPFGAFTEAFTRFIDGTRTASTEDVAMLLGDASAIAAPFADLLSSEAPPENGPKLRRETIIEAFQRCLRTACGHAPVVLVIENLQWADRETLEAFEHVARIATSLPLLVIASHRPAEPGSAFDDFLKSVASQTRVHQVRLAPLGVEAATALCRSLVEPAAVAIELGQRLHRTVGGSPGHIIEAIRVFEDEGHVLRPRRGLLVAQPSLSTAVGPRTAEEIVQRRFAMLTEVERRYAHAAAIQGAAFDTEVARIACGLDHREGGRTVGELELRGLVTKGGVARRFTSNLVFDHAHDAAQPQMQRDLHEATAAAFLESRNPLQLPPSQIHGVLSFRVAWHYLLSGRASRGLLYVNVAVSHLLATWRLGDADRLTALACRVLAADPQRALEHLDMLIERARVLGIAGHLDDQRNVLDEALAKARDRKDFVREARILEESVRNHIATGRDDLASAHADEGAAAARRAGDTELELRVKILGASAAFREGRLQDVRVALTEAVEAAHARQDGLREGEALQALGTVFQAAGEFDEAEHVHDAALGLFRAHHDLAREAEALTSLGNLAAFGGDLVKAEGCLRRALAIHAALGDGLGETRVLGQLAMVLQESGCIMEARDAHRTCVERTTRIGARANEIVARLNLATSEYFLGNLEEARDEYGDALRAARELGDVRLQGYALTGLGDVARQAGSPDVARDLFKRAILQFRRTGDPSGLAAGLLAAARADAFEGESERARSMANEALRLAAQQNARQVAAVAGALLALLDAREGAADSAGRRIAEANVALDDIRPNTATNVELLFLHSLVLRVLRRPTEADRKLLQAEVAVQESLRGLPDAEHARVISNLSPYREISVGAESARRILSSQGARVGMSTDTVAIT